MLPYAKFCVTSWLLLFAASSRLCRSGSATPLRHTDRCLTYSAALLRNVSSAVEELGFYCSKLSAEINKRTLSVCEPKNSTCSNHQTSAFNEDACFSVIREDLQYYKDTLPVLQNAALSSTLLAAIEDLMKNCALPPVQQKPVLAEASPGPTFELMNPFDVKVRLCKVLRGFHIRTITVNRVMGYIAAGDHLK